VFDLATFGLLWLHFHEAAAVFRTGWFLESIATQTLVIFLIRTPGPAWRDAPNGWLVLSTLGALAVAVAIPYSPLAAVFGFRPPPAGVTVGLAGLVVAYLIAAELVKPLALPRGVPETPARRCAMPGQGGPKR
jgi:Mg2+-importing ATPase